MKRESEKKSKFSSLVFNCIAPGVGFLALKKKVHGWFYLSLSILCCFWFVFNIIALFVRNFANIAHGTKCVSFWNMVVTIFTPVLAIVVLWIISSIDLFIVNLFSSKRAPLKNECNDD